MHLRIELSIARMHCLMHVLDLQVRSNKLTQVDLAFQVGSSRSVAASPSVSLQVISSRLEKLTRAKILYLAVLSNAAIDNFG